MYFEKATKFCEISTVDLSYVVSVKSTVEISQNTAAFSEYMNFKVQEICKANFLEMPHPKKQTTSFEGFLPYPLKYIGQIKKKHSFIIILSN